MITPACEVRIIYSIHNSGLDVFLWPVLLVEYFEKRDITQSCLISQSIFSDGWTNHENRRDAHTSPFYKFSL